MHRVGRTARAGRGGFSLTLITPNDIKLLHAIEGRIGKQLNEFKINGNFFINTNRLITMINKSSEHFSNRKRSNQDLNASSCDETRARNQP